MIELGNYNTLKVLRSTSIGLFLGDDEGTEILLPNKYVPEDFEIDQEMEVFCYHRNVLVHITYVTCCHRLRSGELSLKRLSV